eukprot:1151364-Pelagomonas_calceolata.AAC.6
MSSSVTEAQRVAEVCVSLQSLRLSGAPTREPPAAFWKDYPYGHAASRWDSGQAPKEKERDRE